MSTEIEVSALKLEFFHLYPLKIAKHNNIYIDSKYITQLPKYYLKI